MADPTATDPDKYVVIFENERVRVLEFTDEPGQRTSPHDHPDSVMVTLSASTAGSKARRGSPVMCTSSPARSGGSMRKRTRARTSARRRRTSSSSS